ncbi:MAG: hypothetical protein ACK53Y_00995, partial [bacterium]
MRLLTMDKSAIKQLEKLVPFCCHRIAFQNDCTRGRPFEHGYRVRTGSGDGSAAIAHNKLLL